MLGSVVEVVYLRDLEVVISLEKMALGSRKIGQVVGGAVVILYVLSR